MRGRKIGRDKRKYCYWSHYPASNRQYVSYEFSRVCGGVTMGEVSRRHRSDTTWTATLHAYPGGMDYGKGKTRDEAVDAVLALVGEG